MDLLCLWRVVRAKTVFLFTYQHSRHAYFWHFFFLLLTDNDPDELILEPA